MKRFPILGSSGVSVPWELVEPHFEQARANHGQSIDRLAERGGLSPSELAAVLTNRPHRTMKDADACDVIFAKLHKAALAEAVAKERQIWLSTVAEYFGVDADDERLLNAIRARGAA